MDAEPRDEEATEALLTRAIRGRRVVSGWYAATGVHGQGMRVLYPHVLYRSAAGELLLDAFQVQGPSRHGRLPDWRVFKVSGLRDLVIEDAVFLPLAQLDLGSPRYQRRVIVHCLQRYAGGAS